MSELTDARLDELERIAREAKESGATMYLAGFDCPLKSYFREVRPSTALALLAELRAARAAVKAERERGE